ncbi:hypothetical protein EVAR_98054_1 [Eumeta japonica]|uniref:Uncharacterized protein n=1 Tax=Eumeta variegata TaxID=151549 RepID=A0A4C1WD84_EUMVA|nr:hypothetical protein EVAR_98054_1 [Eumeta japonica]
MEKESGDEIGSGTGVKMNSVTVLESGTVFESKFRAWSRGLPSNRKSIRFDLDRERIDQWIFNSNEIIFVSRRSNLAAGRGRDERPSTCYIWCAGGALLMRRRRRPTGRHRQQSDATAGSRAPLALSQLLLILFPRERSPLVTSPFAIGQIEFTDDII